MRPATAVRPCDVRLIGRRSKLATVAVACLALATAVACTENDEQLIEDIGVTRLFVIDPGLLPQSLFTGSARNQSVVWEIDAATLEVGDSLVDLLFGEPCVFIDTVAVSPQAAGPCLEGIVIDSADAAQEIRLELSIGRMSVRRGERLDLTETFDFDGDGVPNDGDGSGAALDAPCGLNGLTTDCDDNCPLISNPDQADNNQDGIGNRCTQFDFFAGFQRDSDGDGVPDSVDNCVWIANADQEDTTGVDSDGMRCIRAPEDPDDDTACLPDGIGDACLEQLAEVNGPFTLSLGPALLLQPKGSFTFVTVDFDSQIVYTCDFDAGTCTLENDPGFCGNTNALDALTGCP